MRKFSTGYYPCAFRVKVILLDDFFDYGRDCLLVGEIYATLHSTGCASSENLLGLLDFYLVEFGTFSG